MLAAISGLSASGESRGATQLESGKKMQSDCIVTTLPPLIHTHITLLALNPSPSAATPGCAAVRPATTPCTSRCSSSARSRSVAVQGGQRMVGWSDGHQIQVKSSHTNPECKGSNSKMRFLLPCRKHEGSKCTVHSVLVREQELLPAAAAPTTSAGRPPSTRLRRRPRSASRLPTPMCGHTNLLSPPPQSC